MKRKAIRLVGIALLLLSFIVVITLSRADPILYQIGFGILPTERRIQNSSFPLVSKWIFDAHERIQYPPISAKNRVLVRTENRLLAVDAQSGREMWAISPGTPLGTVLPVDWRDDRVLLATDRETSLRAYEIQDGKSIWTIPSDNFLAVFFAGQIRSIVIDPAGIRVYTEQGRDPHIRAYSLQDGQFLWQTSTGPAAGFQYMAADESNVYAFIANDLCVIDAQTGVVKNRLQGLFGGGYVRVMNSQVYLVDKGNLIARELGTGDLQWMFDGNVSFYSASQARVYTSSHDGRLTAVDNQRGKLIWQQSLSANAASEVITIGKYGYVIEENGSIVSFDLETGHQIGLVETFPSSISPLLGDKGLSTNGSWLFATLGDSKLFAFGN